jgi:predicted DNA-binding protein with PD1-like motif
MKMIATRLKPETDLKVELEKLVVANNISSGYVATCVGSLHKVTIRMAGAKPEKQDIRILDGDFEIVSLVGTVSTSGSHLHISVSDTDGNVIGGHLKEGSLVTTTAEVVIGYDENLNFKRVVDPDTGFEELEVSLV